MKNILFRADSSSEIGTGHIMRDLVLAEQYPDAEISFAVQDLKGNINYKIEEKGYKVIILKSNDVDELVGVIQQHEIDMVVIDHYDIDHYFEKTIKNRSCITLLAFDDTYEKHHCDILLNHNLGADQARYIGLVSDNCELRCGEKHTLIREEFVLEKSKNIRNKQSIFIAMGGADHSNLNISLLEAVHAICDFQIELVTTTANSNICELEEFVEKRAWVDLHVNSNKIAQLLNKSIFSIITPSVMVNEVMFMCIPFIAIKTADNQSEIYEHLRKNNYLVLEEFNDELLQKNIVKVLHNV